METGNKYKYSRAYFKILNLILSNPNESIFVIRGGQGASKTISIIELIIQALLSSEKEASILSSELSKMKRTVIRDYKKICKDWGIFQTENDFNKSESKHEYPNGSYLDFLGADVNDIGKGFRRDILYINEADRMNIETAVQFISRAKLTIIDYNPDKLFWGDEYINDNNFITLTFEDNEYLPQSEVNSILDYRDKGFFNTELLGESLFAESNIKNGYWANRWRVYGLGLVGSLSGTIFTNWQQIDNLPNDARLLGIGLDFGYSVDPTACIGIYKYNDSFILHELIYQKELSNKNIFDLIRNEPTMVICDSAEPKSIAELQSYGLKCMGALKGKDSILHGIQLIQQQNLLVTKHSTNLIKELRSYVWATDRNNKPTGEPIEIHNHLMDAMRYGFTHIIQQPGLGTYRIR